MAIQPVGALTTQQLDALIAQLTILNDNLAVQADQAANPNTPQPRNLQQVIPLPVSPATLVQSLFASQEPGVAAPKFFSYNTAVAAAGTATLSYTLPTGYALLFVGPFVLEADYYSPDLTATLTVDTQNVLYSDFAITKSFSQVLPQYGVIRRQMVADFVNLSSTDANIQTSAEGVLVQNNDYDGVILPLLKVSYKLIQFFSENQVALGGVS